MVEQQSQAQAQQAEATALSETLAAQRGEIERQRAEAEAELAQVEPMLRYMPSRAVTHRYIPLHGAGGANAPARGRHTTVTAMCNGHV